MSAAPNRPHCEQSGACKAKGKGHCRSCHMRAAMKDPAFRERQTAAVKANWQDPAFRERQTAATKAACAVWPDCPDHLASDYETLRHYMSAREARAALDPDFAAKGEAA